MARKKNLPEGIRLLGDVWYRDYVDPAGKRVRKSLKTKDRELAQGIVNHERAQLLRRAHGIEPRDASVESFLRDYQVAAALTNTADSLKEAMRRIKLFFQFNAVQSLARIAPEDVVRWQQYRLSTMSQMGTPLSCRTVAHDVAALRAGLNWAVRVGRLEKNPCDLVRKVRPAAEQDIDYLTETERDELLRLCREPIFFRGRKGARGTKSRPRRTPLFAIVALAVYAGLRLREILHLSWEDLDFTRKELRVRSKSGFRTKNRKNRTVPLVEQLEGILSPLRKPAGPCFTTSRDSLYGKRNMLRELDAVTRRMPPRSRKINFITLRHTFATHLASKGMSIFAVSKFLGHHSVTVTEQHYARFFHTDVLRAEMSRIFYGQSPIHESLAAGA